MTEKTVTRRHAVPSGPISPARIVLPPARLAIRRILGSPRQETKGTGGEILGSSASRFSALHGRGRPLPASERSFFEPRFGRDLAAVRIHEGPAAAEAARSVGARAFTLGDSIVFGRGAYGPGTREGRKLLAHELAHVAQQERAQGTPVLRRQALHASCAGRDAVLNAAWAEGERLARETVQSLESVRQGIGYNMVSRFHARAIEGAFGDVGLAPGFTRINDLIGRYERILGGFRGGSRTLRCDPTSIPGDHTECDHFGAFVVIGNATDIFVCPSFFEPGKSATNRGVTLLHEMAHSVLGIGHQGGLFQFFDCSGEVGLTYDDAKRNAYPYGILADCLHGEGTVSEVVTATRPAGARAPGGGDPRWSISAAAGADVTPGAERFAAALGGRVSLRSGEFVVVNPVLGVNLLYLPSGADPSHLLAATAEVGLRIQQPLEGFYFDVSAGGFAGFNVAPGGALGGTGGLTGTAGLGWRWERLELGAEARALTPGVAFDRTQVMVFGRAALRFP